MTFGFDDNVIESFVVEAATSTSPYFVPLVSVVLTLPPVSVRALAGERYSPPPSVSGILNVTGTFLVRQTKCVVHFEFDDIRIDTAYTRHYMESGDGFIQHDAAHNSAIDRNASRSGEVACQDQFVDSVWTGNIDCQSESPG